MGTNQQLTTEQLEVLKFIYEVERMENEEDLELVDKRESIIGCLYQIADIKNTSMFVRLKNYIKRMLKKIKQILACKKKRRIDKINADFEKLMKAMEILESNGFIDEDANLTPAGRLRIVTFTDMLEIVKTQKPKGLKTMFGIIFDIATSLVVK